MPHHARLALTLSERLEQMELDMTAVHDAIARLADRLDAVEQLIKDRDESHVAAISTQVERVDTLLTSLKDEIPEARTDEQPLADHAEIGEPNDHNLLN
jgi:septal ring factor EnvC (AmiA/AmiB activator)